MLSLSAQAINRNEDLGFVATTRKPQTNPVEELVGSFVSENAAFMRLAVHHWQVLLSKAMRNKSVIFLRFKKYCI